MMQELNNISSNNSSVSGGSNSVPPSPFQTSFLFSTNTPPITPITFNNNNNNINTSPVIPFIFQSTPTSSTSTSSSSSSSIKKRKPKSRNPFIGPSSNQTKSNFPEFPTWTFAKNSDFCKGGHDIKNKQLFNFDNNNTNNNTNINNHNINSINNTNNNIFLTSRNNNNNDNYYDNNQSVEEDCEKDNNRFLNSHHFDDNTDDDEDNDEDDDGINKNFEWSIDMLATIMPVNITLDVINNTTINNNNNLNKTNNRLNSSFGNSEDENSIEFKKWKMEDETRSNEYFSRPTIFPHININNNNINNNNENSFLFSNQKSTTTLFSTTTTTTTTNQQQLSSSNSLSGIKRKSSSSDCIGCIGGNSEDDTYSIEKDQTGVSAFVDENLIDNINLSSVSSIGGNNGGITFGRQTTFSTPKQCTSSAYIYNSNSNGGNIESGNFKSSVAKRFPNKPHYTDTCPEELLVSPINLKYQQQQQQTQKDNDLFLTPQTPIKMSINNNNDNLSTNTTPSNRKSKYNFHISDPLILPDISPIKIKHPILLSIPSTPIPINTSSLSPQSSPSKNNNNNNNNSNTKFRLC